MSFPSFLTILVYSKLKLSQTKGGEKNEINFSTEILSWPNFVFIFGLKVFKKKTFLGSIVIYRVAHSYS